MTDYNLQILNCKFYNREWKTILMGLKNQEIVKHFNPNLGGGLFLTPSSLLVFH